MSDTPQTDEAQFGTGRVSVDFARRLERELVEAREQRDRLAAIARELTAMIRVNVMWGRFAECSVEQIDEHLKPWNEKIAAVEGGSDERR